MMRFELSWTTKSGTRVEHQIYTLDLLTQILRHLEEWGCTHIEIKVITEGGDK